MHLHVKPTPPLHAHASSLTRWVAPLQGRRTGCVDTWLLLLPRGRPPGCASAEAEAANRTTSIKAGRCRRAESRRAIIIATLGV